MDIIYIEAYERIQLGISDKRILSYHTGSSLMLKLRERVLSLFADRTPEGAEIDEHIQSNELSEEQRQNRMIELKSIIQRSHPDKPTGDIVAFRAAKEELAGLRRSL